jgi:hypothetical protein
MIYEILHKEIKREKDEFDITYYIELKRNSVNTIYEYLGLYIYDFRKYYVTLNYYIKNENLILENILKNIEKIYNGFNETRKLSIISKYAIYIVSKNLNIPLYRLIKNVHYESNGNIIILSANAFVKSIYRLQKRFEKLTS